MRALSIGGTIEATKLGVVLPHGSDREDERDRPPNGPNHRSSNAPLWAMAADDISKRGGN
jgi:hypothetical protein